MKIGVDVRCFAQGKNTGVEEYTRQILEAIFQKDSNNQYILFFNAWHKTDIDFSWATKHKNVRIKRYAIPNKLLNLSLWFLKYPKLDVLCGNCDIFFMPNSNFYAISKRAKLFLTVHDLSFEHYKQTFSWKHRVWHYFVNPRLLAQNSDHVFAVSNATKTDLRITYGIKKDKITVTKNGVPNIANVLNRNSLEVIKVKEKYKLPFKFILYFGTIEPRKNIIGIVNAYNIIRSSDEEIKHKLVIAGADGWGTKKIFDIIDNSKFKKDIIILKNVPEEDKQAIYLLASVFVYPSFFEGFGFPPLEAMKNDIPIIVSNTTSMPEIVADKAIMIDALRKDELLNALYSIIREKEIQNILTKNTKKHINKFQWTESAQLCIDTFNSNNFVTK